MDDRSLVTGIVQYHRENGEVVASIKLCAPKTGKCYVLTARQPVAPIIDELRDQLAKGTITLTEFAPHVAEDDLEIGFGWEDVVSGVKSVASGIAKNRVTEQLNKLVSSPLVQKGMGLASTFYPPLGATYGAIAAGSKLLDMARGSEGSTKAAEAQNKLAAITNAAKALEPTAIHANALLQNLYAVKKHEPSPGVPAPSTVPQNLQQVIAPPYKGIAYVPAGTPTTRVIASRTSTTPRPSPAATAIVRSHKAQPQAAIAPSTWRRGLPGGGVTKAAKATVAGYHVGGWGWNVPYRGVIQAAVEPDPGKYIRSRYYRGLQRGASR